MTMTWLRTTNRTTILGGADHISDGMLNAAAEAIPKILTPEALSQGDIYPRIADIRKVSAVVASAVIKQACAEGREGRGGKIINILKEGTRTTESCGATSSSPPHSLTLVV